MKNVPKIFLFLLWMASLIKSEDNTIFMLANNFCVTNSSSAIVFTKGKTDLYNQESVIYPAASGTGFNCKFEIPATCHPDWLKRKDWVLGNSHSIIDPDIITDKRWESFNTWKTYGPEEGKYNFVYALDLKEVKSIPLSINADEGVHIYLCDESGTNPHSSKCYWIQFGAYDRSKSLIRKCDSGYIPDKYGIWPQENCKINRDSKTGDPFQNTWNHFVIQKFEKSLKVFQNNEVMMEYIDEQPFRTTKLFIQSDGDASWKIHTYAFLESRNWSSIEKMGPPIRPTSDKICISMFVKTAVNTTLTIRIKSTERTREINETFGTDGKWQERKFFKDKMLDKEYDVYFLQPMRKINYWAIADVRECSEKEYRFIRADGDELSCEKIEDSVTITLDKRSEPSTDSIDCDSRSIGTGCVPCYLFGRENCGAFKYCQLYNGATKCFCSAGYKNNSCNQSCDNGYYGHGCNKRGHCKGRYNERNGICLEGGCQEPYSGETCENVDLPFFKNPPTVKSFDDNSFEIVQSDQQYEGDGLKYYYQYAEYMENSTKQIWQSIGPFELGTSSPTRVEDGVNKAVVNSDTNYIVRSLISSNSRKPRNYQQEYFEPYTILTTSCKRLTDDDIKILPQNTSATVSLRITRASCRLNRYTYYIDAENMDFISERLFNITGLEPYNEYNFYLVYKHPSNTYTQKIGPIFFKTEEGVPNVIQNLTYRIVSQNEVHLSWQEPVPKYGIIENYEITYKVIKSLACSVDASNAETKKANTFKTHFVLEDLKPYTRYGINIVGYTKAGPGKNYRGHIDTSAADLSEAEKINIIIIKRFQTQTIFKLDDLNCSNILGPLYLKFGFNCSDVLCSEENFLYEEYIEQYSRNYVVIGYENMHLRPFSNYTVKLSVSRRNDSNWIDSVTQTFRTPPDKPHQVSDLMLYSKTGGSFSIRWKPPYPPTGILEEYLISYGGYYHKSQFVKPEQCELWHDYHCATIEDYFYKWQTYYPKVRAKNKDTDYGPYSATISISMKDEGPSAPYNITYKWSDDNELFLTMYHPNNTNGKLTSFDIHEETSHAAMNMTVNQYNLTYTYKIEQQFQPCRSLNFKIRAHNNICPGEYTNTVIKSPPVYPQIRKTSYNITNTTISMNISIDENASTIDFLYILLSPNDNTEDLEEFKKSLYENKVVLETSSLRCRAEHIKSFVNCDIGNNISNTDFPNPPLEPGKNYSIAVVLVNRCNGYIKPIFSQIYVTTEGNEDSTQKSFSGANDGLWALILLLVVPLIVFGIWYYKKQQPDLPKLIKRQNRPDDQIALTDKQSIKKPRVNIVKPKPSIVLPAVTTKHSRKVRIIDFENYVKESIENGELERQHNLFAKGLLKPHEVGSSTTNKNKNRYKNLIAYDHTRVKLKRPPGSDESNYINANYIDGYRKPRTYIATQGPKLNTLDDFWIMIWQTNVKYIVMLANVHENGKKKVEKYWPDINENKQYGDITVHYFSSTVFANFDERIFTVSKDGEERKITQLHFTTWPDHGIPLYSQSLVPFLQKILKLPYGTQYPILIHCSAGVGRTGTIILSDICLRMAAGEGSIDFLAHLENLRNQRANLVDNIEQYKLAHLVVLECLFGMRTAIPCTDDMRTIIDSTLSNNGVKTQMKYILETQWHDSAMETMLENEEAPPIYPEKNRFNDILPEQYRVYITKYPYEDNTSSYINAVFVDGFRSPGRFIVTQQPMPNTIGDFWRMVWERSSTVIISLNTINLKDKTVCQIWPEKDEELHPVDFIKIIHKKTQRLDFYRVVTVELLATQTGTNSLIVNILAMDNWSPQDLLPNSIEEFLTYMDAADALSRLSENVIVTCYDGAKASGLYIALSFLIEKMKLEQNCDVCLAVRTIRHSRKQFITSEEQYEFLYRASLTFITGFQSYSNFT